MNAKSGTGDVLLRPQALNCQSQIRADKNNPLTNKLTGQNFHFQESQRKRDDMQPIRNLRIVKKKG